MASEGGICKKNNGVSQSWELYAKPLQFQIGNITSYIKSFPYDSSTLAPNVICKVGGPIEFGFIHDDDCKLCSLFL